jgi:hypothetical protein
MIKISLGYNVRNVNDCARTTNPTEELRDRFSRLLRGFALRQLHARCDANLAITPHVWALYSMPVVIAPEDYTRWLSTLEPDARNLLVPYPAEPMTMWPISTRVNKPENDDGSILDRVTVPD